MKLIILALAMLTASLSMAHSACDQHIVCGSYSGPAIIKNSSGTEIGRWQETIVLAQGAIDNSVSITFAVTYEDGAQESHQFDLIFTPMGSFDIQMRGHSLGSGMCMDNYCTYKYSTQSGNASGSMEFKDAELIRRQEQVDAGQYSLIEQTLTKSK